MCLMSIQRCLHVEYKCRHVWHWYEITVEYTYNIIYIKYRRRAWTTSPNLCQIVTTVKTVIQLKLMYKMWGVNFFLTKG